MKEYLISEAHSLIADYDAIFFRVPELLKELRELPQSKNIDNIIEELEYIEIRL